MPERTAAADEGFAPRLRTLNGAHLAYVDWSKPNGEVLYEVYRELLHERYDVDQFDYYAKPTSSTPIPEVTWDELSESEPDGVILAIADCGSCNSTVVIDAIDLESAGFPTAQVITDRFLDLNRQISAGYGHETMPLVSVPHPTRYLDASEVRALGETTLDCVRDLLTNDDWEPHHMEA